jgi:hypothetical protein
LPCWLFDSELPVAIVVVVTRSGVHRGRLRGTVSSK